MPQPHGTGFLPASLENRSQEILASQGALAPQPAPRVPPAQGHPGRQRGCQCWGCLWVPWLPRVHPQTPALTFCPLGPTTQISPGRPCRGGAGCECPTRAAPWGGWASSRTPLPRGSPRGCPGTAQHYSHRAPGAPACPVVPRRPSHPSGPAGHRDVTRAASRVVPGRSWSLQHHCRTHEAAAPAAILGPAAALDSPSAHGCLLSQVFPARRSGCPWMGL